MKMILQVAFCLFLFVSSFGFTDETEPLQFGYISYSTFNIGDDIQALAAKNFLPKDAIGIDREFMGVFAFHTKVKAIINGWLMHGKDNGWYRTDVPAPLKSWPPVGSIDPLLISIHFPPSFMPFALSQEGIQYMKEHGPVGARDLYTLDELQKKDIPAYYSGCLTLTLDNPYTTRNNIIYLVDVPSACAQYIKSKVKSPVVQVSHAVRPKDFRSPEARLKYAEECLNRYRQAKCVVTTRFHATMPCLAIQTPVLLIADAFPDKRFNGNLDLVRHCTAQELLGGRVNFNFDAPSENPKTYLPLRNKMKAIVKEWVEKQ